MLSIITERRGEWYVARSEAHGLEHSAPDRMTAFNHVLLQLMAKGLIRYA